MKINKNNVLVPLILGGKVQSSLSLNFKFDYKWIVAKFKTKELSNNEANFFYNTLIQIYNVQDIYLTYC